jgi:hypothetical protein
VSWVLVFDYEAQLNILINIKEKYMAIDETVVEFVEKLLKITRWV